MVAYVTDSLASLDETAAPTRTGPSLSAQLASLPKAPRTPVAKSLMEDGTVGQLWFSSYASGYAFVFQGDDDFIARWHNWAINHGLVGPEDELLRYNPGGNMCYVCVHDRSEIIAALTEAFEWELRRNRTEIQPTRDEWDEETGPVVEWDEVALRALAGQKAEAFMDQYVKVECVLNRSREQVYDYSPCKPGRAESSWGRGLDDAA